MRLPVSSRMVVMPLLTKEEILVRTSSSVGRLSSFQVTSPDSESLVWRPVEARVRMSSSAWLMEELM